MNVGWDLMTSMPASGEATRRRRCRIEGFLFIGQHLLLAEWFGPDISDQLIRSSSAGSRTALGRRRTRHGTAEAEQGKVGLWPSVLLPRKGQNRHCAPGHRAEYFKDVSPFH